MDKQPLFASSSRRCGVACASVSESPSTPRRPGTALGRDTIERSGGIRFDVVRAAQHFLLNVLPLRQPDSTTALATFVAMVERSSLPPAEVDAILLRCLAVLDRHNEQRIPSLVEQYLATTPALDVALEHFTACVTRLFRHRGIQHGAVQQAVEIVHRRLHESGLTPRSIAGEVGMKLSPLDVVFKRQMSCTITEYIREVRLERSLVLLATTGSTIKEVWAAIGYNHSSNFNHDFKRRFGLSPSSMRARTVRPLAQLRYDALPTHHGNGVHATADNGTAVMLVDDDECVRSHVGSYLRHHGYRVSVALTGGEALTAVRQHLPDIILVEYHLEDMDGVAFLRALRLEVPRDVPAVALFTADWDLFERAGEVRALQAVIASKLCDLEQVQELVMTLSPTSRGAWHR
jgi:AraC-like DNA-binding protein/CheY-like chemotaxis protein